MFRMFLTAFPRFKYVTPLRIALICTDALEMFFIIDGNEKYFNVLPFCQCESLYII